MQWKNVFNSYILKMFSYCNMDSETSENPQPTWKKNPTKPNN